MKKSMIVAAFAAAVLVGLCPVASAQQVRTNGSTYSNTGASVSINTANGAVAGPGSRATLGDFRTADHQGSAAARATAGNGNARVATDAFQLSTTTTTTDARVTGDGAAGALGSQEVNGNTWASGNAEWRRRP